MNCEKSADAHNVQVGDMLIHRNHTSDNLIKFHLVLNVFNAGVETLHYYQGVCARRTFFKNFPKDIWMLL